MNRIFGTGKAKPKPSSTDAISSTDTRIGSVEVKIKKSDAELGAFKAQMAKSRDGPGKNAIQQRASRTLKQKRMYENQLMQSQQQTWNMEQAAMTTENLKNTMATVDAMKVANKEMKRQYKGIDIDKIESIHYDMEDLIEQANEIQESSGRSYGVPDEVDEADLQAELDALGLDDEPIGEGEMPSYLNDATTSPDFIDAAPVEESQQANAPTAEVAR